MAKARMLHKKISVSLQVNKLPLPARLLFTWMIAHADDDGRMRGEPEHIKASVVPLTKWSFKRVESYLEEMDVARLIHWWTNPKTGEWFVEFVNWKKYQTLKSDRYKESDLPSFSEESGDTTVPNVFQDGTRLAPQSNISELNSIEVNKSEEVADNDLFDTVRKKSPRIMFPKDFEPRNELELAALEAWRELEPNNQFAFMPTYLGAIKKGLPATIFYQFASEIKQDATIREKGKVFNAKVKEYLEKHGARSNK